MIIMIDNYDSFTYNLVQYIQEMGIAVKVFRNDKISVNEIESFEPEGIVISPGPGRPESAGVTLDVLKHFSGKIPILGVCLGHQAIATAFGGEIISAKRLMHGKTSTISADGEVLYQGVRKPFIPLKGFNFIRNRS
jgi:anthranilate synthase/aminodeoxychorismate synthase-like glutamine amidotransferase